MSKSVQGLHSFFLFPTTKLLLLFKKKTFIKYLFFWYDSIQSEQTPTLVSDGVYWIPFHGASVHFLFVVEQAVGCAGDRNGGVQAQRFSCGQNQLTLQL